jgi:hypothetical protein
MARLDAGQNELDFFEDGITMPKPEPMSELINTEQRLSKQELIHGVLFKRVSHESA